MANVLVLPMIPVVMLLVFTVGVVAMISVPVAVVIGTIPSALLTLQIWVIDRLSRVSWARTEVEISLAVMIISFIIIFCFGYIVHCRSLHHESLPDNDDQLTLV